MNTTFIVNISYNNYLEMNQHPQQLYLRIMPMFVAPEDLHLPVKRCLNHQSNGDDQLKAHVVLCRQPAHLAIHEGHQDASTYQERLSIKIAMNSQQPRVDETIGLEFFCQNSCTSGINRRCTALLFALETAE